MEWYYQKDGGRAGPVSDEGFKAAVDSGDVKADTLVWNETMTEWEPYADVGELPESDTPDELTIAEPSEPIVLPDADSVVCRACGCVRSPTVMIPFENRWVCSDCKDTFFQKLKEGVALDDQDAVWQPTGGKTPNSEIAAAARECLNGKVMATYGVLLIYGVCQVYRGTPYIAWLLKIFLKPPFVVGFARYFLVLTDGEDKEELVNIFSGFSKYGTAIGAVFIRALSVYLPPAIILVFSAVMMGVLGGSSGVYIFLGLMALSAVIFAFLWISLFFVEWVIAADEELGVMDALSKAWSLVRGHRLKLFALCLRYFWMPTVLCGALVTTIGALMVPGIEGNDDLLILFIVLIFVIIGLFYLIIFLVLPYYFSAVAIFFRDLHEPEYD